MTKPNEEVPDYYEDPIDVAQHEVVRCYNKIEAKHRDLIKDAMSYSIVGLSCTQEGQSSEEITVPHDEFQSGVLLRIEYLLMEVLAELKKQ